MELGQVSEQVNVTAEAPLIDTADASTGQVIDSQKLADLPNLGRNPFRLSRRRCRLVQLSGGLTSVCPSPIRAQSRIISW